MSNPTPRWQIDLERLLPIRSQFVISGSIHDSFLAQTSSGLALVPFIRALWESLKKREYAFLLVYDPTDGIRVYPDELAAREQAEKLFDLKLKNGSQIISLETLTAIMKNCATQRTVRCALVINFASRISREASHLSEAEYRFFIAAEKCALSAAPIVTLEPIAASHPHSRPLFNPVLWLVNRAQDLPSWYTLDNERVASLIIGKPDYETRYASAQQLAPLFAGFNDANAAQREQFLKRFAEGCEGLSLAALSDITELADRQKLGIHDIDDAVRCYQLGALDNPWRKDYLREKIRDAMPFIEERVKGQHPAVVKTLDILKRSVMGMTGAQAKSGGNRPRGVLFFAGPTGVGKTELAKTLTQLVFGDERAYLRFDMSEFAEPHSGARLLGAPPGYVGFDAGGELTNAVREKPFSVVLFDEIEKAHPQILDKFLQILEDGRLTDGRGETAYFSETILVFTSNLGIFVEDRQGVRTQQVKAGDNYEFVETKVRASIEDYFKFKLARPEILNRIGDNIVVFNFITPDVAERIFDGMLKNVARRLFEEFKLRLSMSPNVRTALLNRCTNDLSNGGRGIGNTLEASFINPLSRALFEHDLEGKQKLLVSDLQERDKVIDLTLALS
ncbi:AAA family ATPase [Sapientia aquatica]|uniref:ATP-dependent Clp protease ATP-binding subunit n=1 Tax=Sapientia aquatica TaxID=1549640 RepID=A0A4R5W7G9_9BURK|nr:AAA family ATPase [Sapientia aquatica]TDK68215.1 ATP-dependent Clp protease ATP-binding subunit [Sapientia aquatica]